MTTSMHAPYLVPEWSRLGSELSAPERGAHPAPLHRTCSNRGVRGLREPRRAVQLTAALSSPPLRSSLLSGISGSGSDSETREMQAKCGMKPLYPSAARGVDAMDASITSGSKPRLASNRAVAG